MTPLHNSLREFWRRLSRSELAALLVFAAGLSAASLRLQGRLFDFLKYLAVLSALYLIVRVIAWGRSRLLWSLRNRLIVAYVFIAFVPILLIITFVVLAGKFLYSQLGAYVLYEDLHRRIEMLADISEHISAAHAVLPHGVSQEEAERVLAAQSHAVHDRELAGLSIEFSSDSSLLRKIAGPRQLFAGLLQQGDTLSLVGMHSIDTPTGTRVVRLSVPVKPEFLATVAPDLGAIQLNLMQPYNGGARRGVIYSTGGAQY